MLFCKQLQDPVCVCDGGGCAEKRLDVRRAKRQKKGEGWMIWFFCFLNNPLWRF